MAGETDFQILSVDPASIFPASTASPTVTATHLVDAEVALKPAAFPIVQRDLH